MRSNDERSSTDDKSRIMLLHFAGQAGAHGDGKGPLVGDSRTRRADPLFVQSRDDERFSDWNATQLSVRPEWPRLTQPAPLR